MPVPTPPRSDFSTSLPLYEIDKNLAAPEEEQERWKAEFIKIYPKLEDYASKCRYEIAQTLRFMPNMDGGGLTLTQVGRKFGVIGDAIEDVETRNAVAAQIYGVPIETVDEEVEKKIRELQNRQED